MAREPSMLASLLGWVAWRLLGGSLVRRATDGSMERRLGAIATLGRIRSPSGAAALVSLLGDKKSEIRCGALAALERSNDPRFIDGALSMLQDSDSSWVEAAARLAARAEPRAVDPLLAFLRSGGPSTCTVALDALGMIGDARAVEPIMRHLGSPEDAVRRSAAGALAHLGAPRWQEWVKGDDGDVGRLLGSGDPASGRPLVSLLGHADRQVRRAAAEALVTLSKERPGLLAECWQNVHSTLTSPHLAGLDHHDIEGHNGCYDSTPHSDYRTHSDRGFGLEFPVAPPPMVGTLDALDPRPYGALVTALCGPDADERFAAAAALGRGGEGRAIAPLIQALGDPCGGVRVGAARALAALGDPLLHAVVDGTASDFLRLGQTRDKRVLTPLLARHRDATAEERACIVAGLGALGDARAVAIVTPALMEESKAVRVAAIAASRALGIDVIEPFIAALQSGDQHVRMRAASALGATGDARAVNPLIGALDRCRASEQTALARALAALGPDLAFEPLVSRVGSVVHSVSAAAIEALGVLGDPRAVDIIFPALGDEDGPVRVAAAQALAALGDLRWLPLCSGKDEDFVALGRSRHPGVFALLETRLKGRDASGRVRAIRGLGELGDPRAAALLGSILHDSPLLCEEGIKALVCLGPEHACPTLITAHTSPSEDVRLAVIRALGSLGDSRAKDCLLRSLADRSGKVRVAGASALAAIGDPGFLPLVRGGPEDFAALGRCGDPRVPRLFLANIASTDADVRVATVMVLGFQDDPRAVAAVLHALQDSAALVRAAAALALGAGKQGAASAALIAALRDRDESVRRAAAQSLGDLADPKAVLPLVAALDDPRESVGSAAAVSLGALRDPRAVQPLLSAAMRGAPIAPISDALERIWLLHGRDQEALAPVVEALRSHRNEQVRGHAAEVLAQLGGESAVEAMDAARRDPSNWVRNIVGRERRKLNKRLKFG